MEIRLDVMFSVGQWVGVLRIIVVKVFINFIYSKFRRIVLPLEDPLCLEFLKSFMSNIIELMCNQWR